MSVDLFNLEGPYGRCPTNPFLSSPERREANEEDAAISAVGHAVCSHSPACCRSLSCHLRYHLRSHRSPGSQKCSESTSRKSLSSTKTISILLPRCVCSHMRELANQLSMMAHSKGITVIAHGSDATDHPEEYLSSGVDYILNGEAEQTLTELCAALLRSARAHFNRRAGLLH